MVTLALEPSDASLAHVIERFGLSPDEIDSTFGLVRIDPESNLYTVLVEPAAGERMAGEGHARGPYADPTIEPYRAEG